jgi:D-beta-D-heptose 7-phosphate kinase/D-beta-D-heptose 1-phosphate adenosyltransferase
MRQSTRSIEAIKILVIGDSCFDVFTYGQTLRLAPEGPAPVFNPVQKTTNGGMALNVQKNIEAIGLKADLITQKESIYKERFIDERTNTLLLRVDNNDEASRINTDLLDEIKGNEFRGTSYDAIIISDYCKGFLSEEDIFEISINNSNVFLDTKKILGEWCKYVSFIKINHVEYDRTKHTINEIGIYNKMIITRSDEGCEYQNKIYPVEKVNIKDVSGAGDTFISGLVCEFCKSKDILKAIKFAQKCATIVVQKKGVCTI